MKKLLPFELILLALVNVSYSETVTLRIDSYSAQSQTDPNHKHKIVIPEISPWDSGSLRFEGTNILALEVGEQYTVRYEAPNSMAGPYSGNIGIVHFEVPAGYKVMVDGYDTSIFYPHGDFIAYQDTDIATLEIVPVMNLDAGSTTDPVLISDEFEMYFGVGKLADGSYLSPAKISADISQGLSGIFDLSNFSFNKPYGDVWYYDRDTYHYQIKKPDIIIDIEMEDDPAPSWINVTYYRTDDCSGTLADNRVPIDVSGADFIRQVRFGLFSTNINIWTRSSAQEILGLYASLKEGNSGGWELKYYDKSGAQKFRTLYHNEADSNNPATWEKAYKQTESFDSTTSSWTKDSLTYSHYEISEVHYVEVKRPTKIWKDPVLTTSHGDIPSNPSGRNLLRQNAFDSYGRKIWSVNASGNWSKTEYLASGSGSYENRVDKTLSPFEDGFIFNWASSQWNLNASPGNESRIETEVSYGASISNYPDRITGHYPSQILRTFENGSSTIVGKTGYAYSVTSKNGRDVLVTDTTTHRLPNSSTNTEPQTTTTKAYWKWQSTSNSLFANKLYSVLYADQTSSSFVHEKGDWNGTAFSPNSSGYAWREISYTGHSTNVSGSTQLALANEPESFTTGLDVEPIYLVPHRSQKSVRIFDKAGNLVRTESYVWGENSSSNEWIPTGSVSYVVDWRGRVEQETHSNGSQVTRTYNDDDLVSQEVGADGQITDFEYDNWGYLSKRIKKGLAGVGSGQDIETNFEYNSLGKVVRKSVKGAGDPEELISLKHYDLAGRLVYEHTANGVGFKHTYTQEAPSSGGLVVSQKIERWEVTSGQGITYDPNSSEINRTTESSWYKSGATKREWGDLAEPRQFKHSFDSQTGESIKTILMGGNESDITSLATWNLSQLEDKKWKRTYTDALGNTTLEEFPAKTNSGSSDTIGSLKNTFGTSGSSLGKVVKVETTGMADYLYSYDSMGFAEYEGADGNGDGVLTIQNSDLDKVIMNVSEYSINWQSNPTHLAYKSTWDNDDVEIVLEWVETQLGNFRGNLRASKAMPLTPFAMAAWQNRGTWVQETFVDSASRTVEVVRSFWYNGLQSQGKSVTKNGFLIEEVTPSIWADSSDPNVGPNEYDYDHLGRKVYASDTRGSEVIYTYHDGTTQVKEMFKTPVGGGAPVLSKEFEYCGCGGQVATETTYHGTANSGQNLDTGMASISTVVEYSYYPSGLLKTKSGTGSMPVFYQYDDHGNKTHMWLYPSGVIDETAPIVGNSTVWEYYANGVLKRKTDNSGDFEENEYNSQGKLWKVHSKNSSGVTINTKEYIYQANGLKLLSELKYTGQDAANTPDVTFTYDRLGRALETQSDYDSNQKNIFGIVSTTQTWTNTYSNPATSDIGYGRLNSVSLPEFLKDGSDNRELLYTYHAGYGWVQDQELKAGAATEWKQSWGYFTDGRPSDLTTDYATFDFDWTPGTEFLHLITTNTGPYTALHRSRVLESNRFLLEKESFSLSYPGGGTVLSEVSYNRDRQGRIYDRAVTGTQFEGYGMHDMHTTFYNYNNLGELEEENVYANGESNPLYDRFRSYDYDFAGNRTDKLETYVGFTMNGSNSSNAYIVGILNGTNQYTSINQAEMWNVFASMYDPAGDASPTTPWILQSASGTNDWWGGTATASGSGGKRYWSVPVDVRADNSSTTWRVHYEDMNNTTSAGSYFPPKNRSPVYDARGNMTFDGYLTYTYDAENRLIKVTDGLLNWHFLYDPWGRRISQRLEGWFVNSSGNWQFRDVYFSKNIYEGWNLILEDVIDDGASSSDEKLFYWGLDISNSTSGAGGIGGLIMTRIDSNNYMVGYDGSGNVINLVDMSTHTIEAKFEYDAFGQVAYQEGDLADKMPFRYQTKWSVDYAPTILLDNNGRRVAPRIDFQLYDYGLRWYHADQGRFINRDPIGESGGLNLYAFVGNDPVNFSDILGLNGTSNSNQAHNYGNYHCGYEHMARHDPDCQVFELDPFEVTTDGPSPWEATRGTEWSVADFNRFSSDTTTLGIGSIPGGTSGGGSLNSEDAEESENTTENDEKCYALAFKAPGSDEFKIGKTKAPEGFKQYGIQPGSTIPIFVPPGFSLIDNMYEANSVSRSTLGNIFAAGGREAWFYGTVRSGGPWDFKNSSRGGFSDGRYEAIGNVNFGATGIAIGFTPNQLYRGAGFAGRNSPHAEGQFGLFGGTYPYGDNREDMRNINLGIVIAENGYEVEVVEVPCPGE